MKVEPIRDLDKLYELQKLLFERKKYRELFLIQLMYNSNLRVGDALLIRWKDILLPNMTVKEKFFITEKKTKKPKMIPIPEELSQALICTYKRLGKPSLSAFIFESQCNAVKRKHGIPWTRNYVTKMLKKFAGEVGIDANIGAHSLRKTFAYQSYKSGTDIYIISKILNHSSPVITEEYAGINQDRITQEYKNVAQLNKRSEEFFK